MNLQYYASFESAENPPGQLPEQPQLSSAGHSHTYLYIKSFSAYLNDSELAGQLQAPIFTNINKYQEENEEEEKMRMETAEVCHQFIKMC